MKINSIKILVLLQIFFCSYLYAQVDLKIDPCGKITQYFYVVDGTIFYPKTQAENKPDSAYLFCNDNQRVYFLDGLKLSEHDFLTLSIKPKHIKKNTVWYEYVYKNKDITPCVEQIHLFLNVNIPININGVELKIDEKEKILQNLTSSQIIAIVRKKFLFKKTTIEITTN